MTEEEKKQLKQKIEEELQLCEEQIGRLKEEVKPVAPDNAIGRLTRMEAIQSQKMAQANLRATEQKQKSLNSALSRLEHEDFGLCLECGEDIPFKRLLLVPNATKCVECS